MVQFENKYRQIKVKIVYYGPALGGKTTCLQHVHRVTDPQRRTKLYSLNTASDRTLFFDLLSLNLGSIRGYRLAIQLYTVPGQVQYNATRRAVLAGVDGVVFVADSQRSQLESNRQSFENLKENLEANGIDPSSIPMVIQYNKRDLKHLSPVDELEALFNIGGLPSFPTVAITGEGVIEAFAAIVETTLVSLADRLGIEASSSSIDRLRQQTRAALEPYLTAVAQPTAADDIETTISAGGPDDTGPLPQDALIGEAVRANLAMTDLSARLETVGKRLERKARITRAIADFGRTVTREQDPAEILRLLMRTSIAHLGAQAATVLIARAAGRLREAVVHGVDSDPLVAAHAGRSPSLAEEIAGKREPVLLAADLAGDTTGPAQRAVTDAGFGSALAIPLIAHDRMLGMLTVYRSPNRPALEHEDLELAAILGGAAAMGYANALAFRQLEESRSGLATTVEQRDDELRVTVEETRRLNRELRNLDRVKNELITTVMGRIEGPIKAINTAAGALDHLRNAPSEKRERLLKVVSTEAVRLAEVIDSIAQASVMVADPESHVSQPSSLPELLRSIVAPVRDLARRLEIEIKVLSPSGLETVTCDAPALATALRAVVKNGVEHTPAGGQVRIEVRRLKRGRVPWVEFAVSDTGPGIPENDRERVFEAFWRGSTPRRGGVEGIGLGLMVARQIVDRHGGEITVTSAAEGGARVAVSLPQ